MSRHPLDNQSVRSSNAAEEYVDIIAEHAVMYMKHCLCKISRKLLSMTKFYKRLSSVRLLTIGKMPKSVCSLNFLLMFVMSSV